ncbi:MAG: single-stranded DNA-binding protein [Planctomycetota bacterium]
MANLNKVLLVGNLTRDPELRYTPSGSAVCEFGVAVNRSWKGQDGSKQEETTFVDITSWGKQAEFINQYFRKGRRIFIEGRLKLDQWTSPEGQKRSKLSVVAENVQFFDSKMEGQGGGPPSGGSYGQGRGAPAGRQGGAPMGSNDNDFGGHGGQDDMPPADDDIPF